MLQKVTENDLLLIREMISFIRHVAHTCFWVSS